MGGAFGPSVDAPGAAGDELGAGDELASFEGFFDGGLVRLAGGLEGEPLGGDGTSSPISTAYDLREVSS
jgi:hypothetical protein